MSIKLEIERLSADLVPGTSRRGVCPTCGGGRTDFQVAMTEEGTVWWKCWRAACSEQGSLDARSTARETRVSAQVKAVRPYTGALLPLTAADEEYLFRRFGLVRPDVQVTEDDEYALPIRDPLGRKRGVVIRQPWWKGDIMAPRQGAQWRAPKALNYLFKPEPLLSWYRPESSRSQELVLVEDQLSAMRIAQTGRVGVALLGTKLSLDKVQELVSYKPRLVKVALDPDAHAQARRLRMQWGGYFPVTRLLALPADPKDMEHKDLVEALA